jgi:hypothetical protein
MWRNPKYPAPEAPAAPAEQGQRLGTFPRGEGVELRVNMAEFSGRPYLSLRVWERNDMGQWWPTKKGVSVRLTEASELARVIDLAATRPTYVEKGRRPQPSNKPAESYSTPRPSAQPFSEVD